MTKAKISEYDAVASNNTDVNGVNIAENCPPSGMNNMGREIMAALKRFQVGSDGDGVTVGGNLVVSGTSTVNTFTAGPVSATTLNTSGAVVFNDAGADVDFRVEGDTDANLLFVDASTDRVGIGTNTPSGLFDVANRGITKGSLPAGSVLQVVSAADDTSVTSTGATILTVNITPTSSSSKILLIGYANTAITPNTNAYATLFLHKNGSAITVNGTSVYAGAGLSSATPLEPNLAVSYLDSPATTSSIAYSLFMARGSGNTTSVSTSGVYSLTVMEIAA